jgi:hypothetical protein
MPSAWVKRRHGKTGVRFRVEYRVGGRESSARYAGSFTTKREALARKAWVLGELAAMRVPDVAFSPRRRPLRRSARHQNAGRRRGKTSVRRP